MGDGKPSGVGDVLNMEHRNARARSSRRCASFNLAGGTGLRAQNRSGTIEKEREESIHRGGDTPIISVRFQERPAAAISFFSAASCLASRLASRVRACIPKPMPIFFKKSIGGVTPANTQT